MPPIGLLDEVELLPRAEAREALGLDPNSTRPSVLVQLGSGTTRDLNRIMHEVMTTLASFPELEVVLVEWMNAKDEANGLWPEVKLLRGFPITRYYRAFDFTVSAAGYNSFNDLLRFGVPTIFVANDAEVMDDQGARARFAEAADAAFDVDENDLGPLRDCVAALLEPRCRAFLGGNARALARPNGAATAAAAIADLLR